MNNRIEILKAYLAEDPTDSFSRYALALEYVRLNHLDEAKVLFLELLESAPDYLPSYYQLGQLLEKMKNPEAAISTYLKGMETARNQKNNHTFNELSSALNQLRDAMDEGE